MKIRLIILFSVLSLTTISAQKGLKDLSKDEIPADVKYKGDMVSCITWVDKRGTNYVVETETPLLKTQTSQNAEDLNSTNVEIVNKNGVTDTIRDIEADYRIKGLFVYHYVVKKGECTLLWKNLDNVNNCSYKNLTANYLTKPLLTDLDKDGKYEVWFVYQLGCRQDKSVALGMKEMLYIDSMAYEIRGLRIVQTGDKKDGGEVRPDKSFMNLDKAFRDYALNLWNQYKEEK